MKRYLPFLLIALLFASCKNDEKRKDDGGKGAEIIQKVVVNAGSDRYESSISSFEFEGNTYQSRRNCGQFELERTMINRNDTIVDVLANIGFKRSINGEEQHLPDSIATKYSRTLNSAHYFVQLPFGLNDPLVAKYLAGETTIRQKPYYEIEVGFDQLDGENKQGNYVCWVEKDKNTIDYLAYQNGNTVRFMEAYNPRTIEGIRFVDYKIYKPKDKQVELGDLEKLFENNQLEELTTNKITAIHVEVLPNKCE